jgi:DNA-binding NtrC family response regulator
MSYPSSGHYQAPRVLFADDDPQVRKAFNRTVSAAGFHVDLAEDGDEALELATRRAYSLLVVDHQMPGPGGTMLVRLLTAIQRNAKVLLVTGHSELAMQSAKSGEAYMVISKPWDNDVLVGILGSCMSRLDLAAQNEEHKTPG